MFSRYSTRILWGIFGIVIIIGSTGCAPKFTVEVSVEPQGAGLVLRDPDQDKYKKGSTVSLDAQSSEGYIFQKWEGDHEGTTANTTVMVDKNMVITARFVNDSNEGEPGEGEGEMEGEGEVSEGEGEATEGESGEGEGEVEGEANEGETNEGEVEGESNEGETNEGEGDSTLLAQFEWSVALAWVGEEILFDGSESQYQTDPITTYSWNFGDDTIGAGATEKHTFTEPGVYTVTLTVSNSTSQDSASQQITVDLAPVSSFSYTPAMAYVNDNYTFVAEEQAAGTLTPSAYNWDFGDNSDVASDATTVHAFLDSGDFEVKLTLFYKHSQASPTSPSKQTSSTQTITVYPEPETNYTYAPEEVWTGEEVSFDSSASVQGIEPFERFEWDFGDGSTAEGATATHTFISPDVYTVTLIAYTATTSFEREQEVTVDLAPSPEFTVTPTTGAAFVEPFSFEVVEQQEGTRPIRSYEWDFGDSVGVSTEESPVYRYPETGTFSPTLTIYYRHSQAEVGTPSLSTMASQTISVTASIYDYISEEDECYSYSTPRVQSIVLSEGSFEEKVATAYIVDQLVSQCWNPDNAVYSGYETWTHPVAIMVPDYKTSDDVLLLIDGGNRNSTIDNDDLELMKYLCVVAGTTIVYLKNVPSQSIVFNDEVIPHGEQDNNSGVNFPLRYRDEDEIIAYTYDQYLKSYEATNGNPNPRWPLLYPMAKAAVKAMDMTEEILTGLNPPVPLNKFIVAGASKRGWTTWLTGAVDDRVKALLPIVINVLNMENHLEHHRNVYGFWSPAIYPYAQQNVFDRLLPTEDKAEVTEAAKALLECIDPYRYSMKGSYPMPKLLINATGDEFFVPDTSELFFHELEGESRLCFIPNVGHNVGDLEDLQDMDINDPLNPIGMLLSWYMAISQDIEVPEFDYSFEEDGSIKVLTNTQNPPIAVRVWSVEQPEAGLRDFRNYKLPDDAWTYTEITSQSPGVYVAQPPVPTDNHYAAFFVQMQFENDAEFNGELQFVLNLMDIKVPDFTFTTGVRVVPDTYPQFTGYLANALRPDAVEIGEDELPVIVVYGTPYDMGLYYGQLLAADINTFIPAYLSAWKTETGEDDTYLANAWSTAASTLDGRILDEIQGISEATGVTVTLEQIQYAHAAMMHEPAGTFTGATTSAYRQMALSADMMQAFTVNGPASRNLQQQQCAVVYIPDIGAPHVLFTYAGMTIGHVGVNLGAISAMEITDPAATLASDANALPIIRTILYDALNLRDGLDIAKYNLPSYATSIVVGDGRNELRSARITVDGLGGYTERYDQTVDIGSSIRGVIYATIPTLENALQTRLGGFSSSGMTINDLSVIASESPFAETGNNLLNIVLMENDPSLSLWVSSATGIADAGTPVDLLDFQSLLP